MAQPIEGSLPADLELGAGYTLRVTALSPSTGAVVAGVNISKLALLVETVGDTVPPDLGYGPYMLVPGPGA